MKKFIATFLTLFLTALLVSVAIAGTIANIRMSDSPNGPEITRFPSRTSIVYVVFDYIDLEGDEIGIKVTDRVGNVLFYQTKIYTGSGTESVPIPHPDGVFPDDLYLTNLYWGGYIAKTIYWEVTEAAGIATPTPTPTATPTGMPTHYRIYLPLILKNYS